MRSKHFKLIYLFVALTVGVIAACSGEDDAKTATNNSLPDVVIEEGEDTTSREKGFFDRKKNPYSNTNKTAFLSLKKKKKNISFFVPTSNGTFFLQSSKSDLFKIDKNYNAYYDKSVKFALFDAKGNSLLPLEYDQIGNPGFIAEEYMEVKKEGKYGLYNYVSKALIAPTFDVIFPSKIMEYIAIGRKNGQLYKIYPNGSEKVFKVGQAAPNYVNLLTEFRMNYDGDYYGMWYHTQGFEYEDVDYITEDRSAMITPPSYIVQMDLIPNLVQHILTEADSLDLKPIKSVKRSDDTWSFISELYTYSAEARGYENTTSRLNTINSLNEKKGSVVLYENDNYSEYGTGTIYPPKATFVSDSLVEVRTIFELAENKALPYLAITKFDYYAISKTGEITKQSNGLFPMTSAIELARYHFRGEFTRVLSEDEAKAAPIYDDGMEGIPMYVSFDHLTIEDLTYMRNEIYARHGLKFNDPKWSSIFKQYKWYKGTKKSVEALLTPVEKKNILFIKNLERELKGKPASFYKPTYNYYVAAG